jgi:hypothetical protein
MLNSIKYMVLSTNKVHAKNKVEKLKEDATP